MKGIAADAVGGLACDTSPRAWRAENLKFHTARKMRTSIDTVRVREET